MSCFPKFPFPGMEKNGFLPFPSSGSRAELSFSTVTLDLPPDLPSSALTLFSTVSWNFLYPDPPLQTRDRRRPRNVFGPEFPFPISLFPLLSCRDLLSLAYVPRESFSFSRCFFSFDNLPALGKGRDQSEYPPQVPPVFVPTLCHRRTAPPARGTCLFPVLSV